MFNRTLQAPTWNAQTSLTKIFPAPRRGWIRNESLASSKPEGAEVLDNFFPTSEGARLRKGSLKHATLAAAATHLTVYDAGTSSKMFAADATSIYDVASPADPDVAVTAAVTGQTGGDYCSFQVATTGGEFLLMFNGEDLHRVYDGSAWAQNTPAITGVSSADISHGWKFKSFVFMVQKGTMDAWYLPAGAIGGAATVFPLGGVFQNGGSLLFGTTWSQDSGAGLDDFCLFFTTEGEIAVYQGTNPASASTFALVGVFRIGRPLGKNTWFKSGGDIAVITDDGIVPVSAAMNRDRTGMKSAALTYPIEEAWRLIVNERKGTDFPFTCVLWPSETMLVVGVPTFGALEKMCLVANARTGAWTRYTGWDTRCVTVFEDRLYFGTAAGTIVQGEVTGSDVGDTNYTGVWLPRFDTFGRPEEKAALHARLVARANNAFTPQLFANADYQVDLPTALSADTDENSNAWDAGIWGPAANASTWGSASDRKQKLTAWQSVASTGHALSPGVQITSGRTTAPDLELVALHLQAEIGEVMA